MLSDILKYINDQSNQASVNVMIFLAGGIVGFLVSRFTLSKSEKLSHEQTIYENSRNHTRELEDRYLAFVGAMKQYVESADDHSLDNFLAISRSGDMYFSELKNICDAILADRIDKGARDRTFVPKVVEALQKNVVQYYEALQEISKKINGTYSGEFLAENYLSMIHVAEKYAATTPWKPSANSQPRLG